MVEAPYVFKVMTLLVGIVTLSKVLWAVAMSFGSVSKSVRSLTHSVERLTERFEAHYADVSEGLADARERIAALEAKQVAWGRRSSDVK